VQFFRRAEQEPDIVWVTKDPGQSQGTGIIVNPDIRGLREKWLVDPQAPSDQLKCKTHRQEDLIIVQKYIRNPLLLGGKKMEIRTYWLIACVEPYIVFYHDGTVRRTTQNYANDDWSNPLIHITNTKQQMKADPNYHNTEQERKWWVNQLADYLVTEGKIKSAPEWLENELRPKLKSIIATVASGIYPHLLKEKTQNGWDGRFELLGMDVILDENLFPWLTEIQSGPSISRDPGVKERMLPVMLEELTDIVLEIDSDFRAGRSVVNPPRSAKAWQPVEL